MARATRWFGSGDSRTYIKDLSDHMQSVHEILAGLTPTEYPELTNWIRESRRGPNCPAEVIVLDEATRNHALLMRREKELRRRASCNFELGTAC
jgi:hypothetical protein